MERGKRLCPIEKEQFNRLAVPIIEAGYMRKGCSLEMACYAVLFRILYVLRTGAPLCDLPSEYGEWYGSAIGTTAGTCTDFGTKSVQRCSRSWAWVRRGDH